MKIPLCKNFEACKRGDGRLFKMGLFSRGYGSLATDLQIRYQQGLLLVNVLIVQVGNNSAFL